MNYEIKRGISQTMCYPNMRSLEKNVRINNYIIDTRYYWVKSGLRIKRAGASLGDIKADKKEMKKRMSRMIQETLSGVCM